MSEISEKPDAMAYLRAARRNGERWNTAPVWFTACHDCRWMQVFVEEQIAIQASEVHSEVLQPQHTSFVGNIDEQLEAEDIDKNPNSGVTYDDVAGC